MSSSILWRPDADQIAAARMTDFLQQVNHDFDLALANYHELHQWSVDHHADFWAYLWNYFDVIGEQGDRVVENPDKLPGATWFPDAQLNFAENLLRHKDNQIALIFRGEDGKRQQLTYAELYAETAALAAAMRAQGITAGDRVAAMMPNCN